MKRGLLPPIAEGDAMSSVSTLPRRRIAASSGTLDSSSPPTARIRCPPRAAIIMRLSVRRPFVGHPITSHPVSRLAVATTHPPKQRNPRMSSYRRISSNHPQTSLNRTTAISATG